MSLGLAIQRRTIDAKNPGSQGLIELHLLQDVHDMPTLHFLK
jgi:hypothetical protein